MDNAFGYQSLLNHTEINASNMLFSGLTADQLVYCTSSNNLDSVANLANYVAGTASQISVANDGDGTITLSTPQNIATTSSPTFAGLTLTGLSGVLKASAGVVSGSATTTDLTEGTNLYYTSARFNTAFSAKTTTDLTEGSNLYYTNARARTALSVSDANSNLTYNSSTGVFTNAASPTYTTLTTNSTILCKDNATIGYTGSSGGVYLTKTSQYGKPAIQAITSAFGVETLYVNPAGGDSIFGSHAVLPNNNAVFFKSAAGIYNSSTAGSSIYKYSDNNQYYEIQEDKAHIFRTNVYTEQMRINSTGVGVGTSSPLSKFVVSSSNKNLEFGYSTGITPNANYIESIDRTSGLGLDLSFYTSSSKTINFYTSGSKRLTIDGSGYVGIGISTPDCIHHVHNSADTISWSHYTNSATGSTINDGSVVGQASNDLYLWNREAGNVFLGTSNAQRLTINSSGYVGIGNTNGYHILSIGTNGTFGFNPIDTYYTDIQQNMFYSGGWKNRAQGGCSLMEIGGGANIAGFIAMYVGEAATSTAAGTIQTLSGLKITNLAYNPYLLIEHGGWATAKQVEIDFVNSNSYIRKHYDSGMIINDDLGITLKENGTTIMILDNGFACLPNNTQFAWRNSSNVKNDSGGSMIWKYTDDNQYYDVMDDKDHIFRTNSYTERMRLGSSNSYINGKFAIGSTTVASSYSLKVVSPTSATTSYVGGAVLGFSTDGGINASGVITSNSYFSATLNTPASSSASGTQGDIKWDTNYIYVCTASNTWKRVALSAF